MDSSAQLIVQGFFADTSYACRTLRRSPSFAVVAVATGNYFDVLGARGRDIDWRDPSDRPRAAVVNVFARTIFDNPDAVGARVRYGQNSEAIQVIGIVEDGKYMSLTEPARAAIFLPMEQSYNGTTMIARSARPPEQTVAAVRAAIATLDERANDRGDAKRLRCWARNSLFETDESATVEAFSTQNSASAAVMSSMAQRELRESPTALRVLVLDNSPDILELLSTDLKCRGCVVTTASVSAIRHGDIDGATFIEATAPDVVVFDVAVPYEVNWRVAIVLQADPRVRMPFVLTTTNATAVRRLIGRDLIELVGKPYDLDTLYDVILRSVLPDGADTFISSPDRDNDQRSGLDRRIAARRQAVHIQTEVL